MQENKNIHVAEVVSFCVNLSRQMIIAGANLERVHLAINIICRAYNLHDVSIFLLSTHISLSAVDEYGNYASRQASIPPAGINLERLKSLNQLSYKVAEITPAAKVLNQMLDRACNVQSYGDILSLGGKLLAMSCLCFMFGGSFLDLIPVAGVTALIHYMMIIFEKTGLDRIVINILTMFIAASFATLFIYADLGNSLAAVLITVSMIVIPGIPLVNAMRNLLCGQEINGILQMLKIFVETMALGMGIYLALVVFKGYALLSVPDSFTNPVLLSLLSFAASTGFAVVFNIPVKDLWLAGLGGFMTRIALIILSGSGINRLLFMTLSASVAALYAEYLAVKRRQPSIYFIYPSIIPLIPGDLFFYALAGLYMKDINFVIHNGINCLLSLSGLSLGFVLSSTVSHYVRRMRYKNF